MEIIVAASKVNNHGAGFQIDQPIGTIAISLDAHELTVIAPKTKTATATTLLNTLINCR